MGTSASILIKSSDEQVCLYQHYEGGKLAATLKSALKRGAERWDDFGYLARIVFCEMIKDDVMGTESYGIYPSAPFETDHVITVDVDAQTVEVKNLKIPFEQFVKA